MRQNLQQEVLLALLGYEGDVIRRSSETGLLECSASLQVDDEEEVPCFRKMINQLVRNGSKFADFFEFLRTRAALVSCKEDENEEVMIYTAVLNELVTSYEEKVTEVEKCLHNDPALGWAYMMVELASSVEEWEWIRIMHDILTQCIQKGLLILDFLYNDYLPVSSVSALSTNNVVNDLKRKICHHYFRKITNLLQFGTPLPVNVSSKIFTNRARHQLDFIERCIHQYKIIYIPLNDNIESIPSAPEAFEQILNSGYQKYNDYLYRLCKDDFLRDVQRLDNLLLLKTATMISCNNIIEVDSIDDLLHAHDQFKPKSPLITSKHLQKYISIYLFLKKTEDAIDDVNEYFGKEFSTYRTKLMMTLNQILLFQKTLVSERYANFSVQSYMMLSLVSSMEHKLYKIHTKLEVLDHVLSDFFIKLPNEIVDSDYHDLHTRLLKSTAEYDTIRTHKHGTTLNGLSLILNWNGWLETAS